MSERELLHITTVLKPIVKIYEECLRVHIYSVGLHWSFHQMFSEKKVTGKNLTQNLFFNKTAGLSLRTLWKMRLYMGFFFLFLAKLFKDTHFELYLSTTTSGCRLGTHVENGVTDIYCFCPVFFTLTSPKLVFFFFYLQFAYIYLFCF